jgi:hypothetical protein
MWEPYHPITYFRHIIAGIIGLIAGLVALSTKKGSSLHIAAGRTFAINLFIAVVTTLIFLFDHERQPLIFILALGAFYLVSSGALSFRKQKPYAKAFERVLVIIPLGISLFAVFRIIQILIGGLSAQILGPLLFAILFGGLLLGDIRVMRSRPMASLAWVKRHLLRMVLAYGFATMALLRIGLDVGLLLAITVIVPVVLALLLSVYFIRRISAGSTATGIDLSILQMR